jgi:hypothetical protein
MRSVLIMLTLVVLVPLMTAGSCHQAVVRDKVVYETELNFWEQASVQTADALAEFIASSCACDAEQKFTTDVCEKAAKKVLVVRTRVPYHHQMALYNAGLLPKGERPPKEPPEVPPTSTLCPVTDGQ